MLAHLDVFLQSYLFPSHHLISFSIIFPTDFRISISNLNRIISETKASIVLTTSHKSKYTIQEWENIFRNRGINAPIDKIHDNFKNLNRKEEILNWLDIKNEERFVIIDDDKSLNDLPSVVKERLVLTSALVGLNDYNTECAINILKIEESVFA